MNSLCFYLSGKDIVYFFEKIIVSGLSILSLNFFLLVLWIYYALSHELQCFAEKFPESIMGVLLYMTRSFSIAAFKILFVLDFDNLIIICLRVICFGLMLFGVIWALLVSLSIFPPKIWEVFSHFLLTYTAPFFLFSSITETPVMCTAWNTW